MAGRAAEEKVEVAIGKELGRNDSEFEEENKSGTWQGMNASNALAQPTGVATCASARMEGRDCPLLEPHCSFSRPDSRIVRKRVGDDCAYVSLGEPSTCLKSSWPAEQSGK